jgi:hypothetical protein
MYVQVICRQIMYYYNTVWSIDVSHISGTRHYKLNIITTYTHKLKLYFHAVGVHRTCRNFITTYIQKYFYGGTRRNTIPEVLSQKDTIQNCVLISWPQCN